MSGQSRFNLALAAFCLLGAVLLGLAAWKVDEADDAPLPTIEAVADLEPPDSSSSARGRIEMVQTGARKWLKLQVRGLPEGPSMAVWVEGDSGTAQMQIAVDGDGDYTIDSEVPTRGRIRVLLDDSVVLSGTLEPVD